MAGGRPGSTPTAVIARGTTSEQAAVRTTLEQLAEVPLGSPSVIVVGPVAALGAETALSELTDFTELTDLTELADLAELTDVPGVPSPALSGRTVVVTRSGPRARGLVAALHDAGAATIEVPLTEQADPLDAGAALRAAAAEVGRFRWVIFTSVNAVTRFMAQLRDARSLRSTLVAAVGPATADALRRAGVEPDLIPEEHWANGLVAEFPDHDPVAADDSASDNEVLFPCAEKVPSTIPDGLAAKGWDVRRVVAYRTVALPPPEGEVLAKIAAADAVVFTAGSSATAYAALDGPEGSPLRVPPLVVCIGPTTAGVARALGMQGVEDAHGPSTSGIVDALIHHLDGRPAGGS
jgi:uroporphyrinogen-III synthase